MQTLLPSSQETGRTQTCFRADHSPEDSASTLLGQILAGRYKILKVIDASTLKGHDLALDQTVNVRMALRAHQRDRDIWRQKARKLILVRNPNFLNVIDMVSNGSSDFVISEYPRGRLIAELLGERSPLCPDDVLTLVRPLADALDLIASGICTASFSTGWAYTEAKRSFKCRPEEGSQGELPQFRCSPSFLLKLDVWDLVKPSKDSTPSLLASKAQKIGSKKLAVREMALLAYVLLGGEDRQATEVEHGFKPVKRLGKAGNAILHLALRGSPFFKNAKGFLNKLESAIRSDTCQRRTRGFETCRSFMAYPGINEVLRRFNQDTEFVAAGLLSSVFCASLLFAVLMPEFRNNLIRNDLREASGAKSDFAAIAEPAGSFRMAPLNVKKSESLENHQKFAEISAKEDPAGSTPSSAIELSPDISRKAARLNQSKLSLRHRQDPALKIGEKIARERSRSSGYFGNLDVKKRLIAFWRKILRPTERPRNWTISSNLNRKEKAAFITRAKP